jgi:hypothetical protein
MKHLLLFLAVAMMASCNTTKTVTNSLKSFAEKHNFQETHSINQVTGANHFEASIDSLYNTDKLKALCDTVNVTFKVVDARVEVKTDCPGAGASLLEQLKKAFAAIEFFK